jgi:hypothetical protein
MNWCSALVAPLPELRVLQTTDVVDQVVATARNAGRLIRTECGEQIGIRRMDGPLLK